MAAHPEAFGLQSWPLFLNYTVPVLYQSSLQWVFTITIKLKSKLVLYSDCAKSLEVAFSVEVLCDIKQ